METFFMPRCPEMGGQVTAPGLGVGVGAQMKRRVPGSLWVGVCMGAGLRSGHTCSNVTEVNDGLAFVGRYHNRRRYRWTPQLQVQCVVGTGNGGDLLRAVPDPEPAPPGSGWLLAGRVTTLPPCPEHRT